MGRGAWLGVTASGIVRSCSKPKAFAISGTASRSMLIASSAIGMLHESVIACISVVVEPLPQVPLQLFFITCEVWGSVSAAGLGKVLAGVAVPFSIAAAATSSLYVEPGWYRSPPIARLKSGFPGSCSSAA